MLGTKFDDDKPRMDLIDPNWELDVARVLTHGAKKYKDYNWRLVHYTRHIAAVMRHLNAIRRGEWLDPDSGLPHAAHISSDAMFLHFLIGETEADELRRNGDKVNTADQGCRRVIINGVSSDYESPAKERSLEFHKAMGCD